MQTLFQSRAFYGALLFLGLAVAGGAVLGGSTQAAILATLIPAMQYSGFIEPVSALEGIGVFIGELYPTTHFLTISRGTFAKGLDFSQLQASFLPLLIAIPVIIGLCAVLLKKHEA